MSPLSQQVSDVIRARRAAIAESIVARELAYHPELEQRYGPSVRQKSQEDAGYHLYFLAEAVRVENPVLFVDYIAWAKVVLASRGVLPADLAFHLSCTEEALREHLPAEQAALACGMVALAAQRLPGMPDDVPTFLEEGLPHAALARDYLQALLRGERGVASRLILDAVQNGVPVKEVYLHVFQRSQYEIGRLWQTNQISVAQEHYCTAATQLVMSQLYPHVFATEKGPGRLVATCVADDLHEIGVRMVADLFELEGWTTYYLGANTPKASVVQIVTERQASVLAVSAAIPYHVPAIEALVAAVRGAPGCRDVKILVGGRPFNVAPELWKTTGADGFASNAQEAVAVANRLIA